MIYLNLIKFVWFKQSIFEPNKNLFKAENEKGKKKNFLYTKHHNLLKIQNKSLMRAPTRADTFVYVKL